MGRLVYGSDGTVAVIDDRALLHLQLAIVTKLRRNEPFAFTLTGRHLPSGQGSCTLWIAGPIALRFEFGRSRPTQREVNAAWVDALVREASRPDGLRIVPEPDDGRSLVRLELVE